ncbi:hypothetical protein HYV10_03620 [Candidatus Dependentiae bacterium]|nr:hypothetical protein [Candidatus Dependentiae bacterium]
MTFLFYVFTIFFHFQQIVTCENSLWGQIIPLIKKTEVNKTSHEILKDCISQAIILNGDNPKPLDPEMLQTLQSLHVFSDILPQIAVNNLQWGYFELAKNTCQITDNLEILKKRNDFSLYLQANKELITDLNEILQSLKNSESDFLLHFYFKFVKEDSQAPTNPIEEGFCYLENLEKKILSNRYTGGLYKLAKQGKTVLNIFASLATLYYFKNFHEHNISELSWMLQQTFIPTNHADTIAASWPLSIPCTTFMTLGTIIGITMTSKSLKADFDQASQKQKSILLFKEVIKASKKIVELIQKNPAIEHFLTKNTAIAKFARYKEYPELLSAKMNHFLSLLEYYPFNQDEPSPYPLWQGKIHETFILYEELKNEIVPLWQELGNLDAQICIQNILTNNPTYFCIPEWIESEYPILEIQDYWHPIIPIQRVIKNNISLGINAIARNAVITGANAGGKTTAMTAIMLSAIFAQSLGIVPAQRYNATPFTRMHTYLDITTNLKDNESLFIAQANRAKHLYKSIKECSNGQKTLTVLDEIFTGTRADFAEKASYEFAEKLGRISSSISIIATHFPKLTELEQKNIFINYQAAPATVNLNGILQYPYLIIPGISDQNIADIILKKEGILG